MQFCVLVLISVLRDGSTAASPDFTEVRLPGRPSDNRQYLRIQHGNGFDVLLIHDPEADKAAAAMNVNVGSWVEPAQFAGLAHFCEHMLFLGTEKYPIDHEYGQYLAMYGGSSNAFTSLEDTNFYFDLLMPDAIGGALDRFAQFFISPLFTRDASDREMNAVDSEHQKNLQKDAWREYQLERNLSSAASTYASLARSADVPRTHEVDREYQETSSTCIGI